MEGEQEKGEKNESGQQPGCLWPWNLLRKEGEMGWGCEWTRVVVGVSCVRANTQRPVVPDVPSAEGRWHHRWRNLSRWTDFLEQSSSVQNRDWTVDQGKDYCSSRSAWVLNSPCTVRNLHFEFQFSERDLRTPNYQSKRLDLSADYHRVRCPGYTGFAAIQFRCWEGQGHFPLKNY